MLTDLKGQGCLAKTFTILLESENNGNSKYPIENIS